MAKAIKCNIELINIKFTLSTVTNCALMTFFIVELSLFLFIFIRNIHIKVLFQAKSMFLILKI